MPWQLPLLLGRQAAQAVQAGIKAVRRQKDTHNGAQAPPPWHLIQSHVRWRPCHKWADPPLGCQKWISALRWCAPHTRGSCPTRRRCSSKQRGQHLKHLKLPSSLGWTAGNRSTPSSCLAAPLTATYPPRRLHQAGDVPNPRERVRCSFR